MKLMLMSGGSLATTAQANKIFLEGTKNVLLISNGSIGDYVEGVREEDYWKASADKVAGWFRDAYHYSQTINSIHSTSDPVKAIEDADSLFLLGGNTYSLVRFMNRRGWAEPIRRAILGGKPVSASSAGTNFIVDERATNDWKVTTGDPGIGLRLLPFAINPHYLFPEQQPGVSETRDGRITEILSHVENGALVHPNLRVLGLAECTYFLVEGDKCTYRIGERLADGRGPHQQYDKARLFVLGETPRDFEDGSDLSFLL